LRYEVPLSAGAAERLSFQSYGPAPEIEGVLTKPLKKHRAENGWFMEYLRVSGGEAEGMETRFELRQVSVSHASPGRINAFHIHPKEAQNELWVAIGGQLLVWLVDCRAGSPTEGARRSFLLSGEEPVALYVPAGVAHGYRAGPEGATLLYAMDRQFNAADPNEGRLPWDAFGPELWEEGRG
jgi:dTDP-4-dehydrorhamnose 3,5-epimerase